MWLDSLTTKRHAVVDPFLPSVVLPGTLFWVFPVPELVGSVAHHFELNVKPEPAPVPDDSPDCAGRYGEDDEEEVEAEDDPCKGCNT
jgi:hypothetical protein